MGLGLKENNEALFSFCITTTPPPQPLPHPHTTTFRHARVPCQSPLEQKGAGVTPYGHGVQSQVQADRRVPP